MTAGGYRVVTYAADGGGYFGVVLDLATGRTLYHATTGASTAADAREIARAEFEASEWAAAFADALAGG